MLNNNIGIIVWKKKTGQYSCYANNCNIKPGKKLDSYIKNQMHETNYKKIIENNENQLVKYDLTNNCNIILKYVPDDIIVELRTTKNINVDLLSSLSHKIRNPLTNIIGLLSVFDKSKLDPSQKEYLNILKQSSYEIIATTNDIIDIVNYYDNELKLNLEKINLLNLLNQCHDIVANDIKKKNLLFEVTINNLVPKNIIGDATKLKQIIINMLTNSIQHLNIGGIVITVSLLNETNNQSPFQMIQPMKPKYNLLFSIKDSGTGMDTSKKKLVCSILGMNHDNHDIYSYTGLGLTISKLMCNLMEGNIWFKTNIHSGTIFYFNIICENCDT